MKSTRSNDMLKRFDEWASSTRGYIIHVWMLWLAGMFTGLAVGLFIGRNF
jgi:hypothetical protein